MHHVTAIGPACGQRITQSLIYVEPEILICTKKPEPVMTRVLNVPRFQSVCLKRAKRAICRLLTQNAYLP
jgi:hypothetical protein